MRKTILSFVQFESKVMDVAANVEKAIKFMKEASLQCADLIVFPELFSTGYDLDAVGDRYFDLAENENGTSVKALAEAAATYNINVVASIAFKTDVSGVIYNSAVVINRKGEYIGVYDKTHLWSRERFFFRDGTQFPVFEMDFGTMGLMICYDGGFPEVSRSLALQGAEIILCPSAFPFRDKDLWETYFKSRSVENTCFVGAINMVSQDPADTHLFGMNLLYNPRGHELLRGSLDKEEMQVFEIDLDDVMAYRKQIPFLRDRKPEIYTTNLAR